jgi:hypothetical protein
MLSIVVISYNYARYLPTAVESALIQDGPREVIVVDDGSTDDSMKVLANYRDRIQVIQKPNGGQASAVYTGFMAARGDTIIFLDSDDVLYRSCASVVREHMSKGISKVQYRLDTIGAEGEDKQLPFPDYAPGMDPDYVFKTAVEKGWYPCPVTSGNAWSREYLATVLPVPDDRFRNNTDGYLNVLAPLYGKVISVSQVLGAYRVHGGNHWAGGGNLTWSRYLRHEIERHELFQQHAERLNILVREDALLHSPQHLECRMLSLRFTRDRHPVPEDRRPALLARSAQELMRSPDLSVFARLIWTAYLALLAVAPVALLERLVPIFRGAEGRSGWVRKVISWTRARPRAAPAKQIATPVGPVPSRKCLEDAGASFVVAREET